MFRSLSFADVFSLLLIVISLLFCSPDSYSAAASKSGKQKVDSICFFGKVYDRLTSRDIVGTKVEVLGADSAVLSVVKGGKSWIGYDSQRGVLKNDSTSQYRVNAPRVEGDYVIRVSKDGYEPQMLNYTLANIKKREIEREMPSVYLSRQKVTTLDEFTVKASKIMFYNKGDTIVYNADAFALPEGSMLDALVAQLPGVEIKGDKIYVNGRFVESLLLNGKDFFKDNKNVMLENIGAYAVKDVAVYEKKDDMAEVLGDRDDVSKEYVMDVRLKKDYMTGYMINAEAGGGTGSRYVGRLFALTYTNNTRLSVYGNTNNINKSNRLSESDWELYESPTPGINRVLNGGIDYRADNGKHTWEIDGNFDASYNDRKNQVTTNAVNFLQTADTYDFSNMNSRMRNLSLSTYHNFKLKKDKWNFTLKPKFSYNKNRNNDETVAATFSEEIQNLNSEIIKSIYSGDNRALRTALINRNLKEYESNGHGWDSQLNAEARVKVPGSPDAMAIKFQTKYSRSSLFGNTMQDICYGGEPALSMLQNRFSSDRPQYNFNVQGLLRYYFNIPFGNLHASYEFVHTQTRKNSDVALLEAQADNDMAEFYPGQLPVPDFANSYTSKLYKNEHRIKIMWYYKKEFSNGKLDVAFQPNIFIENQHLFYHRGETNADPSRTYVKFSIPDCRFSWSTKDDKWRYWMMYRMHQNSVNLVNLVDIKNTTDPMNIWLGNPDLKNSTDHSIVASIYGNPSKIIRHAVYLEGRLKVNDFVNGYRYDTRTGVRTMKTYNVNGNYNLNVGYNFTWRFGNMERFSINNSIGGSISNYANMIGNDSEPVKQKVRTYGMEEDVYLSYRYEEKGGISLMGGVRWNNTHSEGDYFTKLNSGVWFAGANGHVKLPLNLTLHTDFRALRRFGYVEDSMNSVDFIWNASLGWTVKKGMFRITLDANDILNQNKGIVYNVNAQGRTQTLSTVLPRYLMLTLHYKFDFKPKRAK